jgi:hypothetical protein
MMDILSKVVMPGLVPGIHVLAAFKEERRGWPGRSPAMTKNESRRATCGTIDAKIA